jgi:hypothetical protein
MKCIKPHGYILKKKIVDFNFKVFFFSFLKKKNYSGGSATRLGHMEWPNYPIGQNVGGQPPPRAKVTKKKIK